MGINTGYCNVGNFSSDNRMDYTIISAEANLAEPGGIVMSFKGILRPAPAFDSVHELDIVVGLASLS